MVIKSTDFGNYNCNKLLSLFVSKTEYLTIRLQNQVQKMKLSQKRKEPPKLGSFFTAFESPGKKSNYIWG
jgi:hypothetical protein